MKKEKTVNADRITYAQLSRLTGTRDKRTASRDCGGRAGVRAGRATAGRRPRPRRAAGRASPPRGYAALSPASAAGGSGETVVELQVSVDAMPQVAAANSAPRGFGLDVNAVVTDSRRVTSTASRPRSMPVDRRTV